MRISSVCYVIPSSLLKRYISSGRDAASTSEFTFLPQRWKDQIPPRHCYPYLRLQGIIQKSIALTIFEFISKFPLSLKTFFC
jgi:hypothetical protein